MAYNHKSLEKILEYCRQCGDSALVAQVINGATENTTQIIEIYCHSEKDAKRKMRNIYKVLWYYPQLKPIISMSQKNLLLTINIGHKIETRGRRAK